MMDPGVNQGADGGTLHVTSATTPCSKLDTSPDSLVQKITFLRMGDMMVDNWDAFSSFLQRLTGPLC